MRRTQAIKSNSVERTAIIHTGGTRMSPLVILGGAGIVAAVVVVAIWRMSALRRDQELRTRRERKPSRPLAGREMMRQQVLDEVRTVGPNPPAEAPANV